MGLCKASATLRTARLRQARQTVSAAQAPIASSFPGPSQQSSDSKSNEIGGHRDSGTAQNQHEHRGKEEKASVLTTRLLIKYPSNEIAGGHAGIQKTCRIQHRHTVNFSAEAAKQANDSARHSQIENGVFTHACNRRPEAFVARNKHTTPQVMRRMSTAAKPTSSRRLRMSSGAANVCTELGR